MKDNLTQLQNYVSTQYGDLTGVIQIDGHDNISSIYKLCEDYGFETKDIFIVGFGLGETQLVVLEKMTLFIAKFYTSTTLNMEIALMRLWQKSNPRVKLF